MRPKFVWWPDTTLMQRANKCRKPTPNAKEPEEAFLMSVWLETGSRGASGPAFHVKRARQIVVRFQNPKIRMG